MTEATIVMVGEGGVGKSALTIRFVQDCFVTFYDPTIEDSYQKQVVVDSMSWFLTIIDTAGQEDFSALRHVYFRTGEAFILVYSVTDRMSFEKIETFYKQILRVKDVPSVPIVIVGNKNDLVAERVVTLAEGKEMAKRMGNVPFMESSAKSGLNVAQMYHATVREVKKRRKVSSNSRMDAAKMEDDARHGKSKKSRRCTIL